jgi:hypothetical protein
MTAAERAQQIAEKAHAKEKRDWWLIRKTGSAEPIPVLFVPPLTQMEVLAIPQYSHCGVIPLLEQVD